MTDLPFEVPGRFWRGNLHTHSDRSDGALSPAETARVYRESGNDFLAITDHFRPEYEFPITDTRGLRSDGFTTLIGAELHAPRTEVGQAWHIVAAGLPLDFQAPGELETGPELARRARAAGAFVGMAHPAASLLTAVDAESLDAAHSVEVYNALADRENRGDSWHLTDVLLNRGHRLTTYAADDAHLQPQGPAPVSGVGPGPRGNARTGGAPCRPEGRRSRSIRLPPPTRYMSSPRIRPRPWRPRSTTSGSCPRSWTRCGGI